MAKNINIDRETIQAIAAELNKLNNQQQPTPSAHAQTGANCENPTRKQTAINKTPLNWHAIIKLCSVLGLFIFWSSVFVILLYKLASYI